jgi:hypothetical protein
LTAAIIKYEITARQAIAMDTFFQDIFIRKSFLCLRPDETQPIKHLINSCTKIEKLF